MVIVTPEVLSTDREAVEAAMVDTVEDTGPGVKVTLAVLDKVILSVVSTAEMVLASGFEDLIVAVI